MTNLADVGQRLREARLARGRSLEELATETHLKLAHLQAIEAGNEAALPEPIYVKSFIRKMAQALGLPADELANSYWQTRPLPPLPEPAREVAPPWWIFPWLVGVVLLGILGYAWYVSNKPEATPSPQASAPEPSPAAHATGSLMASGSQPASPSASGAVPVATGVVPVASGAVRVATPSLAPSVWPSPAPTSRPTPRPTFRPSPRPTPKPSQAPTALPSTSASPTEGASAVPAPTDTFDPIIEPSAAGDRPLGASNPPIKRFSQEER